MAFLSFSWVDAKGFSIHNDEAVVARIHRLHRRFFHFCHYAISAHDAQDAIRSCYNKSV